jgi:heterodisulfide reductase subunit D
MLQSDGQPLYWTDEEVDLTFARRVGPAAEALKTCIQCGSCTASCPTANRMDVSPQRLGRLIRLGMRDEVLASGACWQCTSCAACATHCPRGIRMLEIIVALKGYARSQGRQPPAEVRVLCDAVRDFRNISGEPNEDRPRWRRNLPQPLSVVDSNRGADVLYFVGCIASFYPRAHGIPQAFGRILEHAGLSVTTLGADEWCCGYPLYNAGMAGDMAELVEHNLRRIKELGARTLVTTCPSCFYTLRQIYPQFAPLPAGLSVVHATQLLAELLDARRLRPGPLSRIVTYHDPCDLGRKSGELDAPRHVLRSLPGVELREMANTGINALCCGGGGDVKLLDLDTTLDVARRRVEQAWDVGADTLVSACQQCKRALVGAVQWMRRPVKVLDVVELVWQGLADEVKW